MFNGLKQSIKKAGWFADLNRVAGARWQEARAASTIRRYERIAADGRIDCPGGASLRTAVAKRLANRGIHNPPRPKGDLHIFLTYQIWNWERVLAQSLSPFGQVTEFEWRSRGFDSSGKTDWLLRREQLNQEMLRAFHEAHARRPIDVVVGYLSGHNTAPDTLRSMGEAGAVLLNFCYDDKLWFPGEMLGGRYTSNAAIANSVDLNLTNAPSSVVKYCVHGGLAMFWPEAAHPDIHRPYDLPFDHDVTFIGARYGWRPAFIEKLERMGIKVACFGNGWPNGSLSDLDMVKLYSRSRITLGFAGVGHSRRLMCLKGRDFEVPMSGGLYLTQNNPELARVFNIGKEIVTYRDESDCAGHIRRLLSHPDEAAAIRIAGRKRALEDHTYEVRWGEAFQMAGLLDL